MTFKGGKRNELFDLLREGYTALVEQSRVVRDRLAENAARAKHRPTPAERLLRRRERKRRGFRGHVNSYVSVILGLAVINVVTALWGGAYFPWVLIVAAAWGIGLTLHALGLRNWLADNRMALHEAEAELGMPEGHEPTLMPLAQKAPAGPALADRAWIDLLARCRAAVATAEKALESVDAEARGGRDAAEQLGAGMRNVERLAQGAETIRRALFECAPDGGLSAEIDALDARINVASDERLRQVYLANRSLLQARRAKVAALASERERMFASAEGFLLAAQNVRLDAARIGAGHVPALSAALTETLDRLSSEVNILRQVEAELETV